MNPDKIKNQAKYIWDRLDDLARSDPDGYKTFIDNQMKEREVFMSNPEPNFCFASKDDENGLKVYVNVCGWKRIPYPETDTEPLKLFAGAKQKYKRTKDCEEHVTIAVAANGKVIDELTASPFDKHDLINLIIEFIAHQLKIKLNKKYTNCKKLYKGDVPADPKKLFVTNKTDVSEDDIMKMAKDLKSGKDILSSPESLLKNLSTEGSSENDLGKDFVNPFLEKENNNSKKNLIEEIGETSLAAPSYSLNEDENTLILKIHLPLVSKTSDCDLDISQSNLELTVPEKYYLSVDFPQEIDDDSALAKFNKKTKYLTLTLPLAD